VGTSLKPTTCHFGETCLISIGSHRCSLCLTYSSVFRIFNSPQSKFLVRQVKSKESGWLRTGPTDTELKCCTTAGKPGDQRRTPNLNLRYLEKPVYTTHYIINDFIFLSLTIVLFGIANIHDFHYRISFIFRRLSKNHTCHDR